MNDLKVFENEEFGSVRTTTFEDEPWFVGKDVAAALGYANPTRAVIMHVDEEDKRIEGIPREAQNGLLVTRIALINESGLYSLILSSKLPKAKAFKRWVTSEVLPTLRKTGSYSVKPEPPVFEPKRTSVGEIASLLLQIRQIQKAQGTTSRKIAFTAQCLCEQFGIELPEDFVEPVKPRCNYVVDYSPYINTTPGKLPWDD